MALDAKNSSSVLLRNAASDAVVVSLHGGQVLSWCPAGRGEQLYCSPLTVAAPGVVVRGGVPICFPQFAARGALPKHGFARNLDWEFLDTAPPLADALPPVAAARFLLSDSATTRSIWAYAFALELTVTLGSGWLELTLRTTNTGNCAWSFSGALHTYLAVTDIRQVGLVGLEGVQYEDALLANALANQLNEELRFSAEIDRVYLDAPNRLMLQSSGARRLCIEQQGFIDTVVWNPGPIKAQALGDLPAKDWLRMLCVEAACVQRPVRLEPGQSWQGCQRLTVLPAVNG